MMFAVDTLLPVKRSVCESDSPSAARITLSLPIASGRSLSGLNTTGNRSVRSAVFATMRRSAAASFSRCVRAAILALSAFLRTVILPFFFLPGLA
jgi:hypothetical protein